MTDITRIGSVNDDLQDDAPERVPNSGSSLLELLQQDLQSDIELAEVTYAIPGRKTKIRYNPNIEMSRLNQWRLRSTPKGGSEPDPLRFSAAVVGNSMVGLVMDGQLVQNDAGKALTVRDAELREMVRASDMVSAVRGVFGADSSVIAQANRLLSVAGYDGEVSDVDGVDEDPFK